MHNVVATIVGDLIAKRTDSCLTERSSWQDSLWTRVVELLRGLSGGLERLQLDRCNASTFAQAVPGAVVADHELGILVKKNGVVLVME
ncbi:hypothetical protein EV191_11119 [Tamaricihabitans halophyticus]|uniref:Uncharacterized protein n=1 Tax=Tamaricihabitans halophyticus TaxID=1262583 RepID=A0A4R2QGW7_9PSEU|nr:hypothetical protein EV191_11119 [Tamaricihabitans halophyticus]